MSRPLRGDRTRPGLAALLLGLQLLELRLERLNPIVDFRHWLFPVNAWRDTQLPGRRESVLGGCGQNFLFCTPQ
jgi:hypothetical protein